MTVREIIVTTIFLLLAFVLGWIAKPCVTPETSIIEKLDTVWEFVHDTTFVQVERKIERLDTVLLATIDTLRDSVLVEVPIERQTWEGENYAITTEGYRVRLRDVSISIPTIEKEVTKTITKRKHWNYGVGVQAGYGITIHGASPYAGVGFMAGYSF